MLRRIRIGFALLAVVLLAALGFLILRTLDTLARERTLEHAAVANRVFDEAEEALADFLRDEQRRPASAYRDRPEGAAWMATRPDFVRAYFEVDHHGRVRSSAGDPALERALRSALQATRVAEREAPRDQPARRPAARASRPGMLAEATPPSLVPESPDASAPSAPRRGDAKKDAPSKSQPEASPGTARNLQSIDLLTGRARAGRAEERRAPADADDVSPYSSLTALETLGRIAKSAAREEATTARAQPERLADRARWRAESKRERPHTASTAPDAAETAPDAASTVPDAAAPFPHAVAEAEVPADASQEPASSPAAPPNATPPPLALGPSRLSGERLDDGRLLLYRTALDDDGRAVRQGMLVSIDGLGEWLTRRVLGESELRDSLALGLHPSGAEPVGAMPSDRYVYAYRFAEPFESLALRLAISPLDDGGNARNIGWLSALLVTASTLGLYAVYRTAAVVVDFAERRSNFAAAVSHELKTPLTAIRMYGEMLRDGMVPDEAKQREYYTTITNESERLTRLIDNVLAWSRLESQRHEPHLVSGDLRAPVRDVVDTVRPHARAEGFEIELRLPPELPTLSFDPDAIQQILYNLIDNAIKYARGHEPTRIEIDVERLEGGVALRVRDHGPGVPAEKLPLVFEAFYRAENELTRQTRGTGIGLALGRGLAESMNGRLAARNPPDGGLEVELWLPLA